MFEFNSKPIQISDGLVLCNDGSIWQKNGFNDYKQNACYKKVGKPPIIGKRGNEIIYTNQFEDMWKKWVALIKNGSTKQASALAYSKITEDDRVLLLNSIELYSKTTENQQYLKRCETYINQKHWESIDSFKDIIKTVIPPMSDEIWGSQIANPDTGITDSARDQVDRFGMNKDVAWGLINDT